MRIDTLQPAEGSRIPAKRLGRGIGSGLGKTSGKGHKGQWARSGGGVRPGFEGGQMPMHRRVPKRGFHNKWAKRYTIINLSQLAEIKEGTVVDLEYVTANSLTKEVKGTSGLKVLGKGELNVAITVKACKFSESAKAAIEKAGGAVLGAVRTKDSIAEKAVGRTGGLARCAGGTGVGGKFLPIADFFCLLYYYSCDIVDVLFLYE